MKLEYVKNRINSNEKTIKNKEGMYTLDGRSGKKEIYCSRKSGYQRNTVLIRAFK